MTESSKNSHISVAFSSLPEILLCRVCDDLSAVGTCAAVCKEWRAAVWDCDEFWRAFRGVPGPRAREAYRQHAFGFDGDWSSRFAERASTDDPVSVLEAAARMAVGWSVADGHACALLHGCCVAVSRCEPSDAAWNALEALELKVSSRNEWDGRGLVRARHALLEKALVAELDAAMDQEMDAHFEGEVDGYDEWVVDGPVPSLLLGPADVPAPPSKGFFDDDCADLDDDGLGDDDSTEEPPKLLAAMLELFLAHLR